MIINDISLPRRWWNRLSIRVSLRTLMMLVLILGGGMGWVAYQAKIERQAAEAILQSGGILSHDWQWHDGIVDRTAQPGWLTRHLGPGYFEHIVRVECGPGLDDAALAKICRLGRLESLGLSRGSLTRSGMAQLRGLTGLTDLRFWYATDRAKGEPLANLSGMVHLRSLSLYGISIADADLAHLAAMTDLEHLALRGDGITDAGLPFLEGFPKLTSLFLDDSKITDAAIVSLTGLQLLETLSVDGTGITDAGLTRLASLPKLRRLYVRGTEVTPLKIASLQSEFPRLWVIR